MEIRVNFAELERAISKMGAQVVDVHLDEFRLETISEVSIELEHGIDVDLTDVGTNAGGLLDYRGHQVVLYIPDQGWRVEDVLADGSKGRKVHVANCVTLDEMREKGRYERYVVRNGLSSTFAVTGMTRERQYVEGETRLRVCMNCLKRLNYKNFNNKAGHARSDIVQQFSLDQFFATYSSYFKYMPRRSADALSTNKYTANWGEISRRYREKVKWRCERAGCGVDLSAPEHRKLLHVHHVNGVKGDNSPNNIRALCVDCHSKEDMHEHLFVQKGDRRTIERLRKAQGRYKVPPANSTSADDWTAARDAADPAVHPVMFEMEKRKWPVPVVGQDVVDPVTKRIIYSNAELVWHKQKKIVVLRRDTECVRLEAQGWTVFTAQELLDDFNKD